MSEDIRKDLKVNKPPEVALRRGPGSGIAPGEKPKNMRLAIKRLMDYMGHARIILFFVMLFAAGGTVFQVLGPKVMGLATTKIAEGLMAINKGTGSMDMEYVARVLMITIGLYLLGSILSAAQTFIMATVTQKIGYRMRRDISRKINRMPMAYFESRSYGDILSRITNDVDTFTQALSQSFSMLVQAATTIIGTVVMMLIISRVMALIALIIIPVSAVLVHLIVRISQKHFRMQQEYLGKINGRVEESFSGQQVIKAFNKEEAMIEEFRKDNDVLYESAWKSQFLSGLMQPIMLLVTNAGYVGVAISGGFFAVRGIIGVGDIQAFIQYVKNLNQPMQHLAQVINQMQSMSAAVERVFEFLDEEDEVDAVDTGKAMAAEDDKGAAAKEFRGAVTFDHVGFGYDKDEPVIHDFSLSVSPGQKIAIVGPTGAGKTTIVKLLMRFYDVDKGRILLDGRNIKELGRHELRSNFGMVLQDTWLYSASIRDNIRYGKPGASDEEVEKAAYAAHIHHFIKTLPGGYDMELLEDASNISQGQRQLMTIARAILADNRILILDEATSSVDTRTEEVIQKAMDNLMKGRTSFIIAHRLSTIKNADVILVMDHGDIIEQGTHEELLEKGGTYAGLYNSQFDS